MRTIKLVGLIVVPILVAGTFVESAQGAIITSYTNPGTQGGTSSIAPTVTATNTTGSNATGGAGANQSGDGFAFAGFNAASLANAITAQDWITWGFTTTAGYAVNLTDLDITYQRQNSNGPPNLVIQASINGGAFQTIFTDNSVNASTGGGLPDQNANIDLSSFTGVTSAVFRAVMWAAPNVNGQWYLLNDAAFGGAALVVNGAVVPEPSSMALMGFASCCSVLALRRRRRKNQCGETPVDA